MRGFQEESTIQSDSPTASKECFRVLLSIIACKRWKIQCIDIKSAFLQGKVLQRDVYLVPPKEAGTEGKLWKLFKCVYGLNDASRVWYFTVWEELETLGCKRSPVDFGIFTWYDVNKNLAGVFQSHVDDFMWAGTSNFHELVILP